MSRRSFKRSTREQAVVRLSSHARIGLAVSVLTAALCATPLASAQPPDSSFRLVVGEGTPLRVAVDRVVIRRVGQHIEGVLVDPVFAHDRIVIPTGTPERPPRQRSRGIIPSSCAKALSSTRGCSPRSILARWRRRRARRSARRRRRRASSRPGSSRRLTPHTRPEEHRSKRWSRVRCSPRPTS